MNGRTDLAIELTQLEKNTGLNGVRKTYRRTEKTKVTEIDIGGGEAQKSIGKPKGKYITVEMTEFSADSEILDDRLSSLTGEIRSLIPDGDGTVLVAGLGNEAITPDALGPECIKSVFSTRHIEPKLAAEIGFDSLHRVCALAPGVLGQTGIETGEIIKSVCDSIKPKAVILVDALAAADLRRLGKTVQITDTGITPGSGVGNSRAEISPETLGVPTVAVGVPTVVDALTLSKSITDSDTDETADSEAACMMVTPREIDVVIHRAARLIALAINCALQPEIEPEILLSVV